MARYLRLGMTQRFVLLVVLCGIAILVPALAYSWQAWNSARSHGLEREGLAPARALLRVVQLTQQHRGLSAVWLGGDESQAGARKARADDVGSALAAFESELGRKGVDAGSALARHWRDSRAAWEALQAEVSRKGLDGGASSARHAVVIAGFLRGLDLVLDHWGLVFDPVAADYYLIVAALQGAPRAIETLGQMRARGANLLSNPDKATPEARAAYSTLANTLEAQVASVGFGLERAAAHGAADAGLAKAMQELSAVGVRGVQYARRHVVEAAALNHPSATFYADMTGIIDAMYVETGRLGERLEASLGERIDVARRDMLLTVAAALALFAAAIGVAVHTGVWLTRSLGSEPDALREAAAAVARGDLAQALPLRPGDGTSVLRAMHDMQRSLARLVGGVRDNAGQVAVASSEIAQGNQDLSSRTESQASALQQTAASMEQLRVTIGHSAESARQASQLATQASEVAGRGGSTVGDLAATMARIHQSSQRIAEIIGTIDGIAFQTNILALNAAVEAARAGDQGRGFAVVAGEVRALAQRSAEAARQVRTLIADSVERVEQGSRQGDEAASTMQEVVLAIRRVSDLIGEVSAAAQQQNSGVAQVSQAVAQMDEATQRNAALVEQSAAAAESLRQQADTLRQSVSGFRTEGARA
jgi:methyl-accepting chemotaxis protein